MYVLYTYMERRTKYGIYLLVFLIAGLSVYGFLYQTYGPGKALAKADIHTTAHGLAASFERDETLADSLYLYKVVSVSGILQELVANGPGDYVARLAGDRDGKTAVDCHLDSLYNRDDPGLRPGDSVTIRGTCAGRSLNILLEQCIIEK
jgi:hypothetical protein